MDSIYGEKYATNSTADVLLGKGAMGDFFSDFPKAVQVAVESSGLLTPSSGEGRHQATYIAVSPDAPRLAFKV